MVIGAIALLSASAAEALPACPDLPGADAALDTGRRFVMLGEGHGTVEIPALFGDIVCHAAKRGPVAISLEYQAKAQPGIDAYMASGGSPADKAAFLGWMIWDRKWADGRNSVAMFDLIERLRQMRAAGLSVRVFATQPDGATLPTQSYRDLDMAEAWAHLVVEEPNTRVLVLAGGFHTLTTAQDADGIVPAAAHLKPEDVLSLGMAKEGGTAWNLQMDGGGPHAVDGDSHGPRGITLFAKREHGIDGLFAIGHPVTPSPPMKDK